MLPNLGTDNLLHILTYLSIKDILSIRCVCTSLYDTTKLRSVWYDALIRETLEKDLPVASSVRPIQDVREGVSTDDDSSSREGIVWDGGGSGIFTDLSAGQLEDLTRRTVILHNNWEDGTPVRNYCFNIPSHQTSLDYTILHFVNARIVSHDYRNNPQTASSPEESHMYERDETPGSLLRHRYLMASSLSSGHAMLTVWDLTKLDALHLDSVEQEHAWEHVCVATWTCSEAYLHHAVNKDVYSPGLIAVALRTP